MSDPVDHGLGTENAAMRDALARALPDTPPPRPAARAAATAAALARFDGADAPATSARPMREPRHPGRWRIGRAPLGALASAALVALIAVPLALKHPNGLADRSRPATLTDTSERAPAARMVTPAQPAAAIPSIGRAPLRGALPENATPTRQSSPAAAIPAAPAREAAPAPPIASVAPPAPPPPPPPPAPVAAPLVAPAPVVVAPVIAEARAKASGEARRTAPAGDIASDVAVTGSLLSRHTTAASRRGDWNACTINAPEGGLRGCGRQLHRGAAGASGAAADALARALVLARTQDWTGAVAALDRAVALEPRLGVAYLNRGLAHQRLGDNAAAAADLDRAVRLDPSARSYYARSRLRREHGDARAARADEERAVELDPHYAAVIRDRNE